MKSSRRQQILETVLVVGAPLALAILELFHPHPHDVFDLDLQTWLVVHYLQIPLMPLAALATVVLVRGRSGFDAALCRVGMFVFAVTYTAFDTAAGLVTGVLVKAAQATSTPEAWRAPGVEGLTPPGPGAAPRAPPHFARPGAPASRRGAPGAA